MIEPSTLSELSPSTWRTEGSSAEESGGYVDVESELEIGATFRVYLPVDCCPRAAETEVAAETIRTSGHESILLVEDEPTDAFLLHETLATAKLVPFQVTQVTRLSAALQHLAAEHWDVVDMNGFLIQLGALPAPGGTLA